MGLVGAGYREYDADYVFVSNSAIDVTSDRTNYSNKLYKKVNGKLQEV